MRKFNRVIALLMTLVLAISLTPFNYSLALDPTENADGGGSGGGGGTGTMSCYRTGYRYYLLDLKTGEQVSNTVDILNSELPGFTKGWIYFTTKYQPGNYIPNLNVSSWSSILGKPQPLGNGMTWTVLRYSDIKDKAGFVSSPPNPIQYINGKFKGMGQDFREWFMRNKAPTFVSTTSNYIKPSKVTSVSGTAGNKGNNGNKGNTGTSGGTSSSSTKNYVWLYSQLSHQCSNTITAMRNTLYSNLPGAPKFSKYTFEEAYTAAVNSVISYAASMFSSGVIPNTPENKSLVAAYMAEIIDQMDSTISNKGWKTDAKVAEYNRWYHKKYVARLESPTNSLLLPVYAANTSETIPNDNIYNLLKFRINDKFVLMPLGMTEDQLEKDKSGNPSVVFTCAAKGYAIMVEPLIWFKPATSVIDTSTGKWVNKNASSFFYGTPTNYGQLNTSGKYNDGGRGSWYWSAINGTFANSLRLSDNLLNVETEAIITAKPNDNTSIKADNATLSNKAIGYGVHAYYFDYVNGLPRTQTYDPDKAETPHPAPDPNPDTGKIPLTKVEPKNPGTKPTKEDPVPSDEGYLNTTRNIHIVKVYDKKKLNGTIEHVTTQYRESNPGEIAIVNEPNYKVVGYFTSPQFYDWLDGVAPINENTPWAAFYYNDDIPKHLESDDTADLDLCPAYNWVMDEANFENNKWASLTDPDSATADPKMATGIARGTVKVGIYYDTLKEGETLTDEEIAARYPENSPYHDNTLYVRLLDVETPPSTHTWDHENYPEGEPGPAPDPEDDPENIKDDNPELYNINIVKVYRTKDLNTGNYNHDGTYVRKENPKTIDIQDEPEYGLTEWFISMDYINPGFSTTWEQVKSGARVTDDSGTKPKRVNVEEPNTTLYVLLEKVEKIAPQIKVKNQISESQLVKSIGTSYILDGSNWGNYWFKATVAEAVTVHSDGSCACDHSLGGSGHTHSDATHMSREDTVSGDNKVYSKWTGLHTAQTIETKSKASTEAFNSLVLSLNKQGREINMDKYNGSPNTVDDEEHTWTLDKNYEADTGIAYFTTIWRGPYDPNVTLAKYKESTIKNTMSSNTWTYLSTLFKSGNTPVGNRMADRNKVYKNVLLTLGISEKDDTLISACGSVEHSDCCCCTINPTSDTKTLVYTDSDGGDGTRIDFKGDFFILAYAGKSKPTTSATVNNLSGFAMSINGKTTTITSHFAKLGRSNLSFYPYIRMSYMETLDGAGKSGWTEPAYQALKNHIGSTEQQNYLKTRTVYVLSDKKSNIIPTNAIDVGWYNDTQASDGYGLQMTSQQWSIHARATSGVDWRQKNQVLPGGALYMLTTKDTETTVKAVTYSTLIEKDSRSWVTVNDSNEYTVDSVITENNNFIKEFKDCLDNLKMVQWVNKDWSLDSAWSNPAGAVKVEKGGESLSNLGLNTKASTDSKYLLFTSTANNEKGASEGDIDIEKQSYLTTVYKGFTDTEGNVYIAQAQLKLKNTELTKDQLNSLVTVLKNTNGTNKTFGTATEVTTKLIKIGTKDKTSAEIIGALQSDPNYNYLYTLDLKTGFIQNLINSVNRNQGDDDLNAWVTDEKWYNEAFDGMYLVQQDITYQIGLLYPSRRTSVLDPNLCPAKSSTGDTLTTAFISQFRMNNKSDSTYATGKPAGYVGTFYGIQVIMPDMENMYYTRPFYIPNANVQDLT